MYDNMKHIHITLEDEEYAALIKTKKEKTWHDLLMEAANGGIRHE